MYTKEYMVGFETFLWGPLDIGVSMDINDCGENFSDRIYVSEPSSRTVYHLIAPAKLRYKTPKLRYKTQSSSFSGVDISSWHQRESMQYHIPWRTGGYISPENTSRKKYARYRPKSCRTAQAVLEENDANFEFSVALDVVEVCTGRTYLNSWSFSRARQSIALMMLFQSHFESSIGWFWIMFRMHYPRKINHHPWAVSEINQVCGIPYCLGVMRDSSVMPTHSYFISCWISVWYFFSLLLFWT